MAGLAPGQHVLARKLTNRNEAEDFTKAEASETHGLGEGAAAISPCRLSLRPSDGGVHVGTSAVAHEGAPPTYLRLEDLHGGHAAQGYVARVAGSIATVQLSRNALARLHVRQMDPQHVDENG